MRIKIKKAQQNHYTKTSYSTSLEHHVSALTHEISQMIATPSVNPKNWHMNLGCNIPHVVLIFTWQVALRMLKLNISNMYTSRVCTVLQFPVVGIRKLSVATLDCVPSPKRNLWPDLASCILWYDEAQNHWVCSSAMTHVLSPCPNMHLESAERALIAGHETLLGTFWLLGPN